MNRVLVIGVTGQDEVYLAKFLLSKGYEVHGIKRAGPLPSTRALSATCILTRIRGAEVRDAYNAFNQCL